MSDYIVGIDIGGTFIKLGIFESGEMKKIHSFQFETPKENSSVEIFKQIASQIENLANEYKIPFTNIIAIGLAFPSPVKEGYVKEVANLNIKNLNIVSELKKYLSFDTKVEAINDANAAAFGENSVLEHPYKNIVFYTLGTGIGGGIIIDSRLVEGSHGLAGEIGHMKVSNNKNDVCGCKRIGCLETKCATSGILYNANKLFETGKYETTLTKETITIKNIFDKREEALSKKVIRTMVKELAKSAVNIALIVDPEVFIIGGGISLTGSWLIDEIEAQYKKHARFSTNEIPFILATLHNDAGFTGAAYYAKSKLEK